MLETSKSASEILRNPTRTSLQDTLLHVNYNYNIIRVMVISHRSRSFITLDGYLWYGYKWNIYPIGFVVWNKYFIFTIRLSWWKKRLKHLSVVTTLKFTPINSSSHRSIILRRALGYQMIRANQLPAIYIVRITIGIDYDYIPVGVPTVKSV